MPKSVKILLVDDSPNVLKVVGTILSARGYQIDTCGDIDAAVAKVQSGKPDLIVLDIMMPSKKGLDGIAVFKEIRENPDTAAIPVLFLSGIAAHTQQSEEDLLSNVGADDFISKPFEPDDLVGRIEKLLKKGNPK